MICTACSGPQTYTNGHRVCANCGAVETVNKPRASSEPREPPREAETPRGEPDAREPQTTREGRKGKAAEERARAPEAAAPEAPETSGTFCGGFPSVHIDPEAAALVSDVGRFVREVAPRARELFTRVRALWNR
ncbi:hypothetical protein [Sorangium sp. So ce385]|uniref:hypothetical protein n=1 Tax=Sorangium sp. So ce385 TaxID=3133308 RepID=UPI003F5C45A5